MNKEEAVKTAAAQFAPIFNFLDWGWRGEGVPDIPKIEATISDLISHVEHEEGDGWSAGTGGIVVTKDQDDGVICIDLRIHGPCFAIRVPGNEGA